MKKSFTVAWLALFMAFIASVSLTRPISQNSRSDDLKSQGRLPTGVRLDPAGRSFDVGNMPLAMTLSPERDYLILSLNGWREQGVQIVEQIGRASWRERV